MATFGGDATPATMIFDSANVGAGALATPPTTAELAIQAESLNGTKTFVLGTIQPRSRTGGDLSQTFSYYYYNRIHIFPNPLDFGSILTDATRQMEVWNAFFDLTQTINTVVGVTLDGVTLAITPPIALAPLASRLFDVTATLEGPPNIDGYFEFTFASGIVERGAVIGQRSLIWPFRHNWSTLPEEELEWLTEILQGGSGKEQRIRNRQNPRRFASLFYTVNGHKNAARMRRLLWFGQPYQYAVPQWQDATSVQAAVTVGANNIVCDTNGRDFDANGTAVLWRNEERFEAHQILSVASGSITLKSVTLTDWRIGDYIVPVRRATLPADFNWDKVVDRLQQFAVRWEIVPGEVTTLRYGSIASAPVYRGRPVLTRDSEASGDQKNDQPRLITINDNGFGIPRRFAEWVRPQPGFDYVRVLHNRADFKDWLGWMYFLKGRQFPIWVPTWQMDAQIVDNILPGDTAIKVADWQYIEFYGAQEARRDIAIILKNGTILYRRILTAIKSSGSTETLNLDSAIGLTLSPSDIDRVSFLRCCRLGSDAVRFTFETDTVMTATVRFTELTTTL